MSETIAQAQLLGRMNERAVLRAIQSRGPMSRAEVSRFSGMSAPTASRAVDALLRAGFLEESDALEPARGRPARILRLPDRSSQVLGLVIDHGSCRVDAAGLDGVLHEDRSIQFSTPETYDALLSEATSHLRRLMDRPGATTLGVGVSLPGLLDYRRQSGLLSPNVPLTDGKPLKRDLQRRLGVECLVVQESHALCLAERCYGGARDLDDFAVLDVGAGVGLGVMSGGRLLTGHRGMAGEIGHITIVPDGRLCGCGNRGCLETVASDGAVLRTLGETLGRAVTLEDLGHLSGPERRELDALLDRSCFYLAIGVAAVINMFNPSTLFVHGKIVAGDAERFGLIVDLARKRTLAPSFEDCRVLRAQGSKQQGAIACIVDHVMSSHAPELGDTLGLASLAGACAMEV